METERFSQSQSGDLESWSATASRRTGLSCSSAVGAPKRNPMALLGGHLGFGFTNPRHISQCLDK